MAETRSLVVDEMVQRDLAGALKRRVLAVAGVSLAALVLVGAIAWTGGGTVALVTAVVPLALSLLVFVALAVNTARASTARQFPLGCRLTARAATDRLSFDRPRVSLVVHATRVARIRAVGAAWVVTLAAPTSRFLVPAALLSDGDATSQGGLHEGGRPERGVLDEVPAGVATYEVTVDDRRVMRLGMLAAAGYFGLVPVLALVLAVFGVLVGNFSLPVVMAVLFGGYLTRDLVRVGDAVPPAGAMMAVGADRGTLVVATSVQLERRSLDSLLNVRRRRGAAIVQWTGERVPTVVPGRMLSDVLDHAN